MLLAAALTAGQAGAQGYVIYKSDGTIERLHYIAVDSITTYTDTAEYVDMGRGVKWATCNLGATSESDAGYFLAWGETGQKDDYSLSTYSDPDYTVMPDTISDTQYDPVKAVLGDEWRMPTLAELNDLCDTAYTRWSLDTVNATPGYRVASRINGNTIFVPATGYLSGTQHLSLGSAASYWSAVKRANKTTHAYILSVVVRSGTVWRGTSASSLRYYGRNLRPVRQ